jgi:uncharacterized protein (TIGR03067 family)
MTKYLLTALVVGLSLASDAAGTDKEDDVKKELEKLEGVWHCVSVEVDQKTHEEWANFRLDIKKDKFTMWDGDTQGGMVTFTIDPSMKPKTLYFDLTIVDLKWKLFGIYNIDECGLKICVVEGKDEKDRPKEFATKKGGGVALFTFKNERMLKAEEAKKWEEEEKRREEQYRRMKEQPRKDAENLQGAWRPVRSEQGALDDTWEVEDHRIVFEKDAFTLKKGDKILLKGTFKLDITKYPKTIDIAITEGGHKEKLMLGIWEMVEGELRWCVAELGKDRPKAFATDKGRTDRLARFTKDKP